MLWLSELLIQRHDLECFADVVRAVQERAREGERFLRLDVRPQFPDTPEDWEEILETAFMNPDRPVGTGA